MSSMLSELAPPGLRPQNDESLSWQDRVWFVQGLSCTGFAVLASCAVGSWLLLISPSPFVSVALMMVMALAWCSWIGISIILIPWLGMKVMEKLYIRRAQRLIFKATIQSIEGITDKRLAGSEDGYESHRRHG